MLEVFVLLLSKETMRVFFWMDVIQEHALEHVNLLVDLLEIFFNFSGEFL